MKSWVLAAGLLAAAGAPVALAADADDEGLPPPKGGAYDTYKVPKAPPRPYAAPPPRFQFQDDDDDAYGAPPPPARRYSGVPPYGQPPPFVQKCVRSEQVRDHLTSLGWHDFHDGQKQGDLVTLRARRPSGRLFELTLHRCSGQLVHAQALEPRRYGRFAFKAPYEPYAYNDLPRRGPYYYGPYDYEGQWYEGPYRGWRRWYRYRD